jgi:hypothetical protein
MLVTVENFALVQFIQILIVLFFVLVTAAIVSVRLRLPRTGVEPFIDILMCVTVLIYAAVFKIIFST